MALAKEEGQELGKEHLTPTTAAGGNTCQSGPSAVTAPPPGNVPGLKERNVGEWWFLADDPAADPWALEEVQLAAMPSRCFPVHLLILSIDRHSTF